MRNKLIIFNLCAKPQLFDIMHSYREKAHSYAKIVCGIMVTKSILLIKKSCKCAGFFYVNEMSKS